MEDDGRGYLRLMRFDLETGKKRFVQYLGALKPKVAGTKRIPDQYKEMYEQRQKRGG